MSRKNNQGDGRKEVFFKIYNEINSQARAKRLAFNLENQELCGFFFSYCVDLDFFFFISFSL